MRQMIKKMENLESMKMPKKKTPKTVRINNKNMKKKEMNRRVS